MSISQLRSIFDKLFEADKKQYHQKNIEQDNAEFDFSDFSMYFASKINILSNVEFREFERAIKKDSINNILEQMYNSEVDNYFTPNFFVSSAYNEKARRKINYTAFLQDIWLDIDQTNMTADNARKRLYNTLEELDIPKPHLVVNTSTTEAEAAKLQIHWLIDPIYIYKSKYHSQEQREEAQKRNDYFKSVQKALFSVLESELDDWDFDDRVLNVNSYARIPNCYHQKTDQRSKVLDFQKNKSRYNLNDNWCQKIKEINNKEKNKKQITNSKKELEGNKNINLMQLEQTRLIIKNGVTEGYRNTAQVAIALCCKHSDYSEQKALETVLEMNENCSPSENKNQVRAVVRSVYRSSYGIDPTILKNLSEVITGQNQPFRIEYLLASNETSSINSYEKQYKYSSKQSVVMRSVMTIIELIDQGQAFTKRDIAEKASVSYDNLRKKKYWNTITEILQKEFSIAITYNQNQHSYVTLCISNQNSISVSQEQLRAIVSQYISETRVMKFANSPP